MGTPDHAALAAQYVEQATELLDRIKIDKRMGRGMDVGDGATGSVATAFATLALYHQRAAGATS